MFYNVLFVLLVISAFCRGEEVVIFSTDFTELPDGWINTGYDDEWSFGPNGAAASGSSGEQYWFVELCTPDQFFFVPDGTDSLVVHIEHLLSLDGDGPCASVNLMTIPSGNITIYYKSSYYPGGGVYDIEPIHWSSNQYLQGTWVGISFYAFKEEWVTGNSASWHLYSLTITAHGSELDMNTITWASVKNSFQ